MGPSISASALKKLLAYSFTSFLLVACGGSGGGSSHPADEQAPIQEDKTPDSFTFSALTDVARDVQLVSEIVTISGINTEIAVSISGGEYSIDGGEFTSTAGTIDNNQSLQLRTQTPLEFAQNKTVTVTLDSLHVSFSIETPDAPRMVSLELMPESAIKAGKNLVVSAICDHCDSSKTRYEWRAGGIDAIVSTEDYYQIPAEHALKEISVTAMAVNTAADEGSSITRIYQSNRVKEIVGNGAAFAAIKADGSVITWGDPDAGGFTQDTSGLESGGIVTLQ